MLASDIREMSEADILARVNELEEERFRLKFRGATENLEDPLRLRVIRKDVARLKTVLRERQLAAAGQQQGASAATSAAGARKRAPKARNRKAASKKTRNAAPRARTQER